MACAKKNTHAPFFWNWAELLKQEAHFFGAQILLPSKENGATCFSNSRTRTSYRKAPPSARSPPIELGWFGTRHLDSCVWNQVSVGVWNTTNLDSIRSAQPAPFGLGSIGVRIGGALPFSFSFPRFLRMELGRIRVLVLFVLFLQKVLFRRTGRALA